MSGRGSATGGGPGGNSRGRGGKFRKFTRGGGKHFSRDLRPLDADGNEISMWSEEHKKKGEEDSDEEEEDSEEDSEEEGVKAAAPQSREDRKADKKARKEAAIAKAKAAAVQVGDMPSSSEESEDDDTPANPNHSKAARNQAKGTPDKDVDDAVEGVKGMSVGGGTPGNRRERESLEAQQAKDRYRKLHEAGKTDEAKADLARLKEIREKREEDRLRKEAEREEKEAQEAERRKEIEEKEAKKRQAALGKPKKTKK